MGDRERISIQRITNILPIRRRRARKFVHSIIFTKHYKSIIIVSSHGGARRSSTDFFDPGHVAERNIEFPRLEIGFLAVLSSFKVQFHGM